MSEDKPLGDGWSDLLRVWDKTYSNTDGYINDSDSNETQDYQKNC